MAKTFLDAAPDESFRPTLDSQDGNWHSDSDEPRNYNSGSLDEGTHIAGICPDLYERATVLVVDDESSIAELIGDVLTIAGYRVLKANNGRVALAIARHEHPALVITDRMMPEIGGIEFVQRLQKSSATRNIPVIMMSSTRPNAYPPDKPPSSTGTLDRLITKGIPGVSTLTVGGTQVGFLEKPFDIDALVEVVDTMTTGEGKVLRLSH